MAVDAIRTPDELLEGLPDYPFESRYREVDGLRLAHLDEGEGKPVVFFHGEPTWSFLWRKVIPPVRDAGFRCIAPDYAGFGRSDKPTDLGWYTYDRHVELMARAAGGTRPARRDRGRPRLGRADRVAAGGRASRPHLPHRDHGDRPLHRPPADERRLVRLPRLRPRERGRAGRDADQRRLQERPGRRGDRRLRRSLYRRGLEGRRPRLPADPADRARTRSARSRANGSPTPCARTSARPSSSGPTPTRCCRSRSANGSPASSTSRRRGRSRTRGTSCRRMPGRRSGRSSPTGWGERGPGVGLVAATAGRLRRVLPLVLDAGRLLDRLDQPVVGVVEQ